MRKIILLLLASAVIGLTSCRHISDVAYFQQGDEENRKKEFSNKNASVPTTYEYLIQQNDILSIYVSSLSPEASSFFNAIAPVERSEQSSLGNYSTRTGIGYLVDGQGMIDLPLVGKVKVSGLTTTVASDTLTQRLERFLQVPSVRIYIQNFRVTILGEVNRPGVYSVTNEKISIPEAVGLAGDLNIFASRKNITLIREEKGERKYYTVNLTDRALFSSSYYYLRSGDILYVPPVSGRVAQSDNFYRILPIVLSSLTLIAVAAIRLTR